MSNTLASLRCACRPDCAGPIVAIKPGQDADYGHARDLFGEVDLRLPPILIKAPVPTVAWCQEAWVRRFAMKPVIEETEHA